MPFQPHIEGLRAIAVLAVVAFHLRLVPGGFIGVDVFFVISGYLISLIIYREFADTGRLNFGEFYLRRFRRIFPALFVTVLGTFLVAAIVFDPSKFAALGAELYASLLSVSNLIYWFQSGYFDAASETKALLHTWSLSVEVQFYLVWAVFLYGALKLGSVPTSALVLSAIIVSFIGCLYAANSELAWLHEPQSALFYLMPFRIFEFAIGALAVWLQLPRKPLLHDLSLITGLGLIAASGVFITGDTVFPSTIALVPCIGALLVIISSDTKYLSQLLANWLIRFIGKISYSLYLVHWPIIVFFVYLNFRPAQGMEILILFVLMFVIAIAMHFWVEQPFRKTGGGLRLVRTNLRFGLGSGMIILAFSVMGAQIAYSYGWAWRMPNALTAEEIRAGKRERFELVVKGCSIVDIDHSNCDWKRPLQVLVFGNSHEPDGYNAFASAFGGTEHVNFISFGTVNGCEFHIADTKIHSQTKARRCGPRFETLSSPDFIAQIDVIVFSSRAPFGANKAESWRALSVLKDLNPSVEFIVFGGYISTSEECATLYNRLGTADACRDSRFARADFDEQVNPNRPSASRAFDYLYIDVMEMLCSDGSLGTCVVETDGALAFYDQHHRSLPLSRLTGERMAVSYGKVLQELGFPPSMAQTK